MIETLFFAPKSINNNGVKNKQDKKNPILLITKINIVMEIVKHMIINKDLLISDVCLISFLFCLYLTISLTNVQKSSNTRKNKAKVGIPEGPIGSTSLKFSMFIELIRKYKNTINNMKLNMILPMNIPLCSQLFDI